MTITSMKLQLHEYNFSLSSALSTLNNKIQAADEHLSFINISKQDKTYGPYITVTNQENVQWVAVTQFCRKVSSQVGDNAGAQYQNCGQFLLMNGYGSKDANATVDTLLRRSYLHLQQMQALLFSLKETHVIVPWLQFRHNMEV